MKSKFTALDRLLLVLFFIIAAFIFCFLFVCWSENKQEIKSYNISDLGDGVYVKYSETVSNIPAQNYEIAIYKIGDKVYNSRGDIEIYFTENEPCVEIKKSCYVNNETVIFYVPEDGVEYTGFVTVR